MKFEEGPRYRGKKETALNRVVSGNREIEKAAFGQIVRNQKADNPSAFLFKKKIPEAVKKELQMVDFENTIHDLLYEYGLREAVDTKIDDILTPTFLGSFLSEDMRAVYGSDVAGFFSTGTYQDRIVITQHGIRLPREILMGAIVHEVIHRNSFNSITLYHNPDSSEDHYAIRRVGVAFLNDRKNKHRNVNVWLNEAITEELTARYTDRYLGFDWKSNSDTYAQFRHTLIKITERIYEKFPEKYESPEDVFKLFAGAALNGRLLPVARAVEKALGKKSFRSMVEWQGAEELLDEAKKNNVDVRGLG